MTHYTADTTVTSVATSAEPKNSKEISLRKFNCLNEVSFEFLVIYLMFFGNLTNVRLEAVARVFWYFFAKKKVRAGVYYKSLSTTLLNVLK